MAYPLVDLNPTPPLPAATVSAITAYSFIRNNLCNQILNGAYSGIIAESDGLDAYFNIFQYNPANDTPIALTNDDNFDELTNLYIVMGLKKKSDPNC